MNVDEAPLNDRKRSRPESLINPDNEPPRKRVRTEAPEIADPPVPIEDEDTVMVDISDVVTSTPVLAPTNEITQEIIPEIKQEIKQEIEQVDTPVAEPDVEIQTESKEPVEEEPQPESESEPEPEPVMNERRRSLRPRKPNQLPAPRRKKTKRKKKKKPQSKTAEKPKVKKLRKKTKPMKAPKRPNAPHVYFNVQSGGYHDPRKVGYTSVQLDIWGKKSGKLFVSQARGHRCVVYDFETNTVLMQATFDTYDGQHASQRMNIFINSIPIGLILIVVVQDSGFWRNNGTHETLERFGATQTRILNRESYLLITWTIPGCKPLFERTHKAEYGPAEVKSILLIPELERLKAEAFAAAKIEPKDPEPYDLLDIVPEYFHDKIVDGVSSIECTACGQTGMVDKMVFCADPSHQHDKPYKIVREQDRQYRKEILDGPSKQPFYESEIKPFLPECGGAFHLWCAPERHIPGVWHRYLLQLAEQNNMDLSGNPYIAKCKGIHPISLEHAQALGQCVDEEFERIPDSDDEGDDGKELEQEESKEMDVDVEEIVAEEIVVDQPNAEDIEMKDEESVEPEKSEMGDAGIESMDVDGPETAEVVNDSSPVNMEIEDVEAPRATEDAETATVEESVGLELSPDTLEEMKERDPEQKEVIPDRPTKLSHVPVFDKHDVSLMGLESFPQLFPPNFAYTCSFHMVGIDSCGHCDQPLVPQLKADVEQSKPGQKPQTFCDSCSMLVPQSNQWIFRCIDGLACKESKEGYDLCEKCVVAKLAQKKNFALCVCGSELLPDNHATARVVCKERMEVQRKIDSEYSFKCFLCCSKIRIRNQYVYACRERNCDWNYQLCLPCYSSLPRTQFRCKDCGHGMHCLYLEDLYKDRKIHESGKLEELRQARAISQQSGRGSSRRSKKKKSNKKSTRGSSTFSAKELDTDELGCTWTDCESDDEGQTKKKKAEDARKKVDGIDYVHFSSMGDCVDCGTELLSNKFAYVCSHKRHGQILRCYECILKSDERDAGRRILPAVPRAEMKAEVVLLFIAHDGIKQPELWKKWRAELGEHSGRIGFAIQANNTNECESGQEMVEEFRIDVKRRTRWGKLSVVTTIQNSMQQALLRFPRAKRFVLISGSEIPIQSAAKLINRGNRTQMIPRDLSDRAVWKGKKLRNASWIGHHAAVAFERDHFRLLASAPIPRYFKDSDNIFHGVGAPDEFCWGTFLINLGIDFTDDSIIWPEMTTDFEMPSSKSRHPVRFDTLDDGVRCGIISNNMYYLGTTTWSLRSRIQAGHWADESIWHEGPCFYRKCASTVDFGDFLPWRVTEDPPEDFNDEVVNPIRLAQLEREALRTGKAVCMWNQPEPENDDEPEPDPTDDEDYVPPKSLR